MLVLVAAREQNLAGVELVENAAVRPHVDRVRVLDAQDNLRRAVKSRLDVSVDLLGFEAARAEIDDFDANFALLLDENVFRLEVAVDDLVLPHEVQAHHDLYGEVLRELQGNASVLVALDELEQVFSQDLKRQDQVLTKTEDIEVAHNTLDVFGVASV